MGTMEKTLLQDKGKGTGEAPGSAGTMNTILGC